MAAKKIDISPRAIAIMLALGNFALVGSLYFHTKFTLASRMARFESEYRTKYDTLVARIIADGVEKIGGVFANSATNSPAPNQISPPAGLNVDNFSGNKPIEVEKSKETVVAEDYRYFVAGGEKTIELRGEYYRVGDIIEPFGVITSISPFSVVFDGGYKINKYKVGG